MATLQNTGRTLSDTVNPTVNDIEYTYKGTQYPIPVCTMWFNTVLGSSFICTTNNGTTATWKEFTLT